MTRSTSDAIEGALEVLRRTQSPQGSWPGDYSGPHFLLPLFVGAWYAVGHPLPDEDREGMLRWLRGTAQADGGYGLGVDNPSCVFTTAMSYVAMRLLGVDSTDPVVRRARSFVLDHGGADHAASWGRFFLTVMGIQPWEGLHPIPPELWLLPERLPVHPSRMWCHSRMVYLPMSWLYGTRSTVAPTPLLRDLRRELHRVDPDRIDWVASRDTLAPCDAVVPHDPWLRVAHRLMGTLERVWTGRGGGRGLRAKACRAALAHIAWEDDATDFIDIGPVSKPYHLMVWHFAGDPRRVRAHLDRMGDYLWRDARGVRVNGYNSSELWDTCFAVDAILATGRRDADDVLERAHRFVREQRIDGEPEGWREHHRSRAQGGWPFSTRAHGWPITDCTAEGLRASLALREHLGTGLDDGALREAVNRILAWQNPCGGWASYERVRGPRWLERLNPSDVFADIMIEHPYTECTSACVQALSAWRSRKGARPDPEVDGAIERGVGFLRAQQQEDGGWFGKWGVCFTYATWFAVEGLVAAGVPVEDDAVRRAVVFLQSIQRPDGGWSEHVDSCRLRRPVPAAHSHPVQTAWAVLALCRAGARDSAAVDRGVRWLRVAQRADGTWADPHVTGVFNQTCSIVYSQYPRSFPLRALAVAGGLAQREGAGSAGADSGARAGSSRGSKKPVRAL